MLRGREVDLLCLMRDLKNFLADVGDLSLLVVASDIMTRNVITLKRTDNFETAFEVFEGKHISTLPVVKPDGSNEILDILKKSDLLLAYNQKILKLNTLPKREE